MTMAWLDTLGQCSLHAGDSVPECLAGNKAKWYACPMQLERLWQSIKHRLPFPEYCVIPKSGGF